MTRMEISEGFENNSLITYTPGNSTKYEVMFAPIPGEGDVAFCWFNPISGSARLVRLLRTNQYGPISYRYFVDKADCCISDAAVLLVLIHEVLKRDVALPPGYDARGMYTGVPKDGEEGLVLTNAPQRN